MPLDTGNLLATAASAVVDHVRQLSYSDQLRPEQHSNQPEQGQNHHHQQQQHHQQQPQPQQDLQYQPDQRDCRPHPAPQRGRQIQEDNDEEAWNRDESANKNGVNSFINMIV